MGDQAPGSEPASTQPIPPNNPASKKPSPYVFDSNGDTRIILSTSMAQTFKWEADKIWIEDEQSTKVYKKWKNWKKKEANRAQFSASNTPPVPLESPVTTATSGFFDVGYSHATVPDGDEADPSCTDPGSNTDSTRLRIQDGNYGETFIPLLKKMEFRMLVSGKHLELASPIFKSMVTGPFTEGKPDSSGFRQITASDWDPEAFKIIMTIMHGYNRDVPRSLSLEMLAKVAMIVNYYDCFENVELYTDTWLEGLRSELPKVYGRDCILCMLVSWVFSEPLIFRNMTQLALMHSQKLIEAEDFPIPADILEEIDIARQTALAEVFSGIYELFDRLQQEQECSFECSSMLVGVLTKGLSRHGILHPRQAPPFDGFSIEGSKKMIKSLKKPRWYSIWDDRHGGHGCCIQDKLSTSLAKVESCLRVFDLQDFQTTKDHTRG